MPATFFRLIAANPEGVKEICPHNTALKGSIYNRVIRIVVTPTLRGSGASALTLPPALGREGPSGIPSAHWGLGQFRVSLPCAAGWGPQRLSPGAAHGAGHPQHSVIAQFWMLPAPEVALTLGRWHGNVMSSLDTEGSYDR